MKFHVCVAKSVPIVQGKYGVLRFIVYRVTKATVFLFTFFDRDRRWAEMLYQKHYHGAVD